MSEFISKQHEQERCRAIRTDRYYAGMAANWSGPRFEQMCPPKFDQTLCFPETPINTTLVRDCPFKFCDHCNITDRTVSKLCLEDGEWNETDYTNCVRIYKESLHCIQTNCYPCGDPFKEAVRVTTLTLCILSVLLLTISMAVFIYFKSIHCRRLTIHMNLAVAFILRFSMLTLWILLQQGNVFHDCSGIQREGRPQVEWVCKMILWWTIFSQLTSVFWMFIEGCYLASRFTVLAMRGEGPLWLFFFVGWGVPFVISVLWGILHDLTDPGNNYCWDNFTGNGVLWIVVVPMGIAIGVNFIILLSIVGILVQKLSAENTQESKRIWKAIKATLLLVPLLGVANILLFWEPDIKNPVQRDVYMIVSSVLQHSQGVSVAVLYCFCNGEVQSAVMRYLKTMKCWQFFTTHHMKSSTMQTTNTFMTTTAENNQVKVKNGPNGRQKLEVRSPSKYEQRSGSVPLPENERMIPTPSASAGATSSGRGLAGASQWGASAEPIHRGKESPVFANRRHGRNSKEEEEFCEEKIPLKTSVNFQKHPVDL